MTPAQQIRERLGAATLLRFDGARDLDSYISGLAFALRTMEPDEPIPELSSEQIEDTLAMVAMSPAIEPTIQPPDLSPPPADTPAPARVSQSGGWSAERDAKLRELWPQTTFTGSKVLEEINALPGPRIPMATSLYSRAKALGMNTRRFDPIPPAPDPSLADDRAEAERMLANGKHGREIAEWLGRDLDQVSGWVAEWRERQKRAAE